MLLGDCSVGAFGDGLGEDMMHLGRYQDVDKTDVLR